MMSWNAGMVLFILKKGVILAPEARFHEPLFACQPE